MLLLVEGFRDGTTADAGLAILVRSEIAVVAESLAIWSHALPRKEALFLVRRNGIELITKGVSQPYYTISF